MKTFLACLSILALIESIRSQTVYFAIKAAPDITIPLGNENHIFWNFPQDSDKTFKNIKVKKQIFLNAAAMPYVKIEYPIGKVVHFTWTTGLGYYFTQYNISWTGSYSSSTSGGAVIASYKVKRHELGINLLPGIAYSNLRIEAGLNLLFAVTNNTNVQFSEGGVSYINNPFYDGVHFLIGCSMPIYVSYVMPVSNKFNIQPFINCEFGILDWDRYDFGDVPVYYRGFVSRFMTGVSFSLWVKKGRIG